MHVAQLRRCPLGLSMLALVIGSLILGLATGSPRIRRPRTNPHAATHPAGFGQSAAGGLTRVRVQVPASMRSGPFAADQSLNVPPGFAISVYARVSGARFMTVAPNGDLFVSQPDSGNVLVLRPNVSGDPSVFQFATGLRRPHGMVIHKIAGQSYLYISESYQIDRTPYAPGDTAARNLQVVVSGLPDGETLGQQYNHPLKNIAIDSSDKLYVSIGSTCNVCQGDLIANPARAAIYQYDADGSNPRIYARGLRNAEGLGFAPDATLWVVVNERDDIAYPFDDSTGQYGQVISSYVDNHPPDEFTAVRQGGNYGWPYCNPDPDTPSALDTMPFDSDYQLNGDGSVDCGSMDRISKGIQAHSAPLGLLFLQNTAVPASYANGAVVCLHGSWDRTRKTGYKVVYFPWSAQGGTAPGQQTDLITGWLDDSTQQAWGRPVGVAVDPQGNIYISDDQSGTIYKLSQAANPAAPAITGVSVQHKNLLVTGTGFDPRAVILMNGVQQKTGHPAGQPDTLIGKRLAKMIPAGTPVNLQVMNSDGAESPAFTFTKP